MPADFSEDDSHTAAVLDLTAAESLARSEVTTAVDVAKRYPRNVKAFRTRAKTLATASVEVAASCYYRLKRKDKDGQQTTIEGPSIRLAEIVATSWTNLRCSARITHDDGKFIVAQGVAHDLESNLSIGMEVRRRITGRNGNRYSDDMIQTTANAACSMALRNAICAVIPRALILEVMADAKQVAIGDASSLDERRTKMVKAFASMGVDQAQILGRLAKASMGDVDLADVEDLIGIFTAIKDGDSKVDEEFTSPQRVRTSAYTPPQTVPARVELNQEIARLRQADAEAAREFDKKFPALHKATDAEVLQALAWLKPAPKEEAKP